MGLDQQHNLIHCSSTFPFSSFNPSQWASDNSLRWTHQPWMFSITYSSPGQRSSCGWQISHSSLFTPEILVRWFIFRLTVLISLKLLHLNSRCFCCSGRSVGIFRSPDPCMSAGSAAAPTRAVPNFQFSFSPGDTVCTTWLVPWWTPS